MKFSTILGKVQSKSNFWNHISIGSYFLPLILVLFIRPSDVIKYVYILFENLSFFYVQKLGVKTGRK